MEAQFIAEVKLDADVPVLNEHQKTDIEKTASEWDETKGAHPEDTLDQLWRKEANYDGKGCTG